MDSFLIPLLNKRRPASLLLPIKDLVILLHRNHYPYFLLLAIVIFAIPTQCRYHFYLFAVA